MLKAACSPNCRTFVCPRKSNAAAAYTGCIPGQWFVMPLRTSRTRADGRPGPSGERVLPPEDLARLTALGIHPVGLSGRLRLVLTIGCYNDFRFTRDILRTGGASEQVENAIAALRDMGANCDCQVLQALGQPPRGVLWHHPPANEAR